MIFFRRSFTGRESYVKAPFQMLFIQRTAGYASECLFSGARLNRSTQHRR
jgi:hypothetical protein